MSHEGAMGTPSSTVRAQHQAAGPVSPQFLSPALGPCTALAREFLISPGLCANLICFWLQANTVLHLLVVTGTVSPAPSTEVLLSPQRADYFRKLRAQSSGQA